MADSSPWPAFILNQPCVLGAANAPFSAPHRSDAEIQRGTIAGERGCI
jgi:hypothetical protein